MPRILYLGQQDTIGKDGVADRVGIGTKNPEGKLSISDASQTLDINPHSAGVDLHSTGSLAPHYQTDFTIYRGHIGSGEAKLTLNSVGNVGIGTQEPQAKLDVSGDVRMLGDLVISGDRNVGATLSDHERRMSALGTTTGTHGAKIAGLEATVDEHARDVDALEMSQGEHAGQISSLAATKVNRAGDTIVGSLRVEGDVRIGGAQPGSRLTVAGTVESTSEGFRFPDGTLQASAATVGENNETGFVTAAVGGGEGNVASGEFSVVPGGESNAAKGKFSLAAGRRAQAKDDGSFVWGDSSDSDFSSTGPDQFLIRASGGVGIGVDQPQAELDVSGSIRASGKAISSAFASTSPMKLEAPIDNVRMIIDDTTGNVGIGEGKPDAKLQVAGVIHSTVGGVKFPDGSVQTSAAKTGGGYIYVGPPQGDKR